jgi:uncharacterized protein YjbI with pentapeptide repeats
MTDDLRIRWQTPPWSLVRESLISRDRPRPEKWNEEAMKIPWPDDLRGIDLRGEVVESTGLDFWNMEGADVEGATFSWCALGLDRNCPRLNGVRWQNCYVGLCDTVDLQATDFSSANSEYPTPRFFRAKFVRASFMDDSMSSTQFLSCNLTDARFTRCDLIGSRFKGSTLHRAVFEECALRGTDFRGVDLRRAKLIRCDLRDAEFEGADLTDADLSTSPPPAPSTWR